MSRRAPAWLPLVVAVLLAACATPPPAPGEAPWTSGRLIVRVDESAGQAAQSLSAAFELRGNGESGELRLNSPLGTRVVQLSRQALGEALPLAALPDWIAGRPWPVAPHVMAAEGFEQLGWSVRLARLAEGWIEARRAAPPQVLVRVRLDESGAP